MDIEWRKIPGYEGFYEASSTGEIRSVDRLVNSVRGKRHISGRVLKEYIDKDGYSKVSLCKYNKSKTFSVHKLVALAFIPNDNPEKIAINHKDENKQNNSVENLEWCTFGYNTGYNNGYYRRAMKKWVPIVAIKGSEAKRFNSITEASKILKLNHANIQGCLKKKYGRVSCGGYKFEYEEAWDAKHYYKRP